VSPEAVGLLKGARWIVVGPVQPGLFAVNCLLGACVRVVNSHGWQLYRRA
jgi:hypothetical protein